MTPFRILLTLMFVTMFGYSAAVAWQHGSRSVPDLLWRHGQADVVRTVQSRLHVSARAVRTLGQLPARVSLDRSPTGSLCLRWWSALPERVSTCRIIPLQWRRISPSARNTPDVVRYYGRHRGRNVEHGLRFHDEGSPVDACVIPIRDGTPSPV